MTFLILGGTGNISSEVVRHLHEQGRDVVVLTRGRSALPVPCRSVVADRSDRGALLAAARSVRPDVVIDFIAYDLPDLEADFECFGGLVRQFVFISSATVYRKPARLPITENAPLGNDWWDYAARKLACEQWLLARWREEGFPVTIVRPSHTYSRGWIPNVISSAGYSFAARLERGAPVFVPDEGESLWTVTTAADFAAGLAGLAGNDQAIGEAFHITSDEALPWKRIYEEIAAAAGVRAPEIVPVPTEFICQAAPELTGNLKGDKAHSSVFDNSKLRRLVPAFACKTPFRDGIRESVAWLRANPAQQKLNPKIDAVSDRVLAAWKAAART